MMNLMKFFLAFAISSGVFFISSTSATTPAASKAAAELMSRLLQQFPKYAPEVMAEKTSAIIRGGDGRAAGAIIKQSASEAYAVGGPKNLPKEARPYSTIAAISQMPADTKLAERGIGGIDRSAQSRTLLGVLNELRLGHNVALTPTAEALAAGVRPRTISPTTPGLAEKLRLYAEKIRTGAKNIADDHRVELAGFIAAGLGYNFFWYKLSEWVSDRLEKEEMEKLGLEKDEDAEADEDAERADEKGERKPEQQQKPEKQTVTSTTAATDVGTKANDNDGDSAVAAGTKDSSKKKEPQQEQQQPINVAAPLTYIPSTGGKQALPSTRAYAYLFGQRAVVQ